MAAADGDGGGDVLHQRVFPAAHVAPIGLQQEGLGVAPGGQTDAIVEDAAIAAVGGVPHRVTALRLAELELQVPRIPVVNNVDVAVESDPARIRDALVRQAYNPVRWVETIQKMAAMGVTVVAECGPGKVLAGLTKRCADGVNGVALADLAAIEANINLE